MSISSGLASSPAVAKHTHLAPRPRTLAETKLSVEFLGDLLSKHLLARGVLSVSELIGLLALAGPIVERVLQSLRHEGRVELRSAAPGSADLRFGLTERGRGYAIDAMSRDGYAGAAPVALEDYAAIVRAQSVHAGRITRAMMQTAFASVVLPGALLDQLGPALNSGRAIFLYGAAGTGKTYIAKRLAAALGGSVLIPHAIAVGSAVVPVFDQICHELAPMSGGQRLQLEQGHDPRYVLCKRPLVVTGGELAADMLEVRRDPVTRRYHPPIQLKANNGLLLIDDLGRHRVPTSVLFNRWIVPMEEQHDYLATDDGWHFTAPFDVVLVFSTNLDPRDLADDAFLRRIGYKIAFNPISPEDYARIWKGVCEERGLRAAERSLSHVQGLYARTAIARLPCHPRDLLCMAADLAAYEGASAEIDERLIERAWQSYFLRDRDPLEH